MCQQRKCQSDEARGGEDVSDCLLSVQCFDIRLWLLYVVNYIIGKTTSPAVMQEICKTGKCSRIGDMIAPATEMTDQMSKPAAEWFSSQQGQCRGGPSEASLT